MVLPCRVGQKFEYQNVFRQFNFQINLDNDIRPYQLQSIGELNPSLLRDREISFPIDEWTMLLLVSWSAKDDIIQYLPTSIFC